MRRSLLAFTVACLTTVSACGSASEVATPASVDSTTTVAPPTTVVTTTSAPESTTAPAPESTTTSTPRSVTTVPMTTVPMTTVPTSSTVPTSTTMPRPTGTPRLGVSQTTALDPAGTRVTVRGTGFDVNKGIYVIVCNQAAWTASRRCVGGINVDGSSPVSEWVSSNPPAYAKGLTVPFAADGSFSVTLLARAIGDEIDCTKEPCGVVAFADHTRRDDRSQDVFVPVSFIGNS